MAGATKAGKMRSIRYEEDGVWGVFEFAQSLNLLKLWPVSPATFAFFMVRGSMQNQIVV